MRLRILTTCLVVALFAAFVVAQFWRVRTLDRIELLLDAIQPDQSGETMQMTSSWKSGGVTHTIETTRQDGESDAEFLARHQSALNAALELYPPD